MILRNTNEFDIEVIGEKGKVIFTLGEGDYADIPVDTREMIKWKIRYPDNRIIHFFDIFDDSLSQVDINLKGIPEYSFDEFNYTPLNIMPHIIL